MLEKLLLPLDESSLAESVLPHAAAMAEAFKSKVTLLHVLERLDDSEQLQVDPLDWHLRKLEVEAYLEDTRRRLQEVDLFAESVLLEGRAAERIVEHAHEGDYDLILVSSHGRSGLSGWNVSSVVQKVILRAYTSIMIIRAYHQPEIEQERVQYRRILVPLDGSQRAENVLSTARALAGHFDAELILVHVVVRPEMLQRTPLTTEESELVERLVERNKNEAQKYLEQLQSRLPVNVQTHLLVSDSATTALHELAEDNGVDLVLLSAHGYSCPSSRPYGSIVTSFIGYGTTPLLIIQDLSRRDLKPMAAEAATRVNVNGINRRTTAYAESPS